MAKLKVPSVVSATFTAVAAAIGAGDVMAGAKVFTNLGPVGGGTVKIIGASLRVDVNALQASEAGYTLHLYNVTPPSALADNAAWDLPSGDRAAYLGKIALGTPVDLGSTLWIETHTFNKRIKLLSANVYGYLVTDAGFTPTAVAREVTLYTDL